MPTTHINLQAAQSSDITRLLKRDFPRQFRRANRIANIHGIFGTGIHAGFPFLLGLLFASPFLLLGAKTILLAPVFLCGAPLIWVGITALLYLPYCRALNSLSALAEERFRVRLCMVGDGHAVVEAGSQDPNDVSGDMYETRAFLETSARK